jgi:hypothetical protein
MSFPKRFLGILERFFLSRARCKFKNRFFHIFLTTNLLTTNLRIAFAMASFRLTQEHHSSIHLRFDHNNSVSANALKMRDDWIAEATGELCRQDD